MPAVPRDQPRQGGGRRGRVFGLGWELGGRECPQGLVSLSGVRWAHHGAGSGWSFA